MTAWRRIALSCVYAGAGLGIYLGRSSLPAYAGWAAVALVGVACWEFEPILILLVGGRPSGKPADDGR